MRIFLAAGLFSCLLLTACGGSEPSSASLDIDSKAPSTTERASEKIEIPQGMSANRVQELLGQADSVDTAANGNTIWLYTGKKAQYAYSSSMGNVHTLVLGGYERTPATDSEAASLRLLIVFDSSRKVVDFNFTQLNF